MATVSSDQSTIGEPAGVPILQMGRDNAIHASDALKTGRASYEGKNPRFYKPLRPAGAMSDASLLRRGVDGRDKPGHDGDGGRGAGAIRTNQQITL
jgi:hypothetical protein